MATWKVSASSEVIARTISAPLRSESLKSSWIWSRPVFFQSSAGCITGSSTSWAPIAFISSRMIASTFWITRRPAGRYVHMPAAIWRISPARTISLWLRASASCGGSLRVGSRYEESRVMGAVEDICAAGGGRPA